MPALSSLPSNKALVLSAIQTLSRSRNARSTKSLSPPIESLRRGDWVKLICGASFEDVADVRNLSLVYTLAGVDCIDCAADASVVNAVNEGINAALSISTINRPWVMISVNDDRQDLHFRKAEFDPEECPSDCQRPCQAICPAEAISVKLVPEIKGTGTSTLSSKLEGGVITERCYGCGRCFTVCPFDRIIGINSKQDNCIAKPAATVLYHASCDYTARVLLDLMINSHGIYFTIAGHNQPYIYHFCLSPYILGPMTYVRDPIITRKLLERDDVDALEIHTSGRGTDLFNDLWASLGDSIGHTKLIAVSFPYVGETTVGLMNQIFSIMQSCPPLNNLWQVRLWHFVVPKTCGLQLLDGRPMSGDIGRGATKQTISYAIHLASTHNRPHGFYQLAGGTNSHTVECLKKEGLFRTRAGTGRDALIGGIAYGGYARKIVGKVLRKVLMQNSHVRIEDHPEHLLEALMEALALVDPVKSFQSSST